MILTPTRPTLWTPPGIVLPRPSLGPLKAAVAAVGSWGTRAGAWLSAGAKEWRTCGTAAACWTCDFDQPTTGRLTLAGLTICDPCDQDHAAVFGYQTFENLAAGFPNLAFDLVQSVFDPCTYLGWIDYVGTFNAYADAADTPPPFNSNPLGAGAFVSIQPGSLQITVGLGPAFSNTWGGDSVFQNSNGDVFDCDSRTFTMANDNGGADGNGNPVIDLANCGCNDQGACRGGTATVVI